MKLTCPQPATPPPEIIEEWIEAAKHYHPSKPMDPNILAQLAARWGYQQAIEEVIT